MISEKLNTQQLFSSLDETWAEFLNLISSVDQGSINKIPFENSWTVAQLATHVKKSNNGIIQALQMQGTPSNKNADERIEELKNIFLDFNAKYQSPEFIIPEQKEYKKEDVINQFKNSVEQLKQLRVTANLSEIINLPIFGEIIKLEILYFVLYHTQRHLRQLKNILTIINKK